ncbi:hypothetical protein SGGMMB4_03043 [Sodalis glossinidius str. 'morsitans']|uniref:Uncharacterized protein n=1 Tax=Sodalis glossinidius (strain morsitans) TaxID=343509 RepID=A0A193QJK8_SODGM|nr:hypothetical protein [Sodalis glossinidius]CRL45374.1 hypothetical protein SGGMMB4_03043 [Sodalis glossinidius str. 'morsitans']
MHKKDKYQYLDRYICSKNMRQNTTKHNIFINNLSLISTCRLRQNRPNLTAEHPTFDEGNTMHYSRSASANSGVGIRTPLFTPRP